MSYRQVKRLKQSYSSTDAGWVHHGNLQRNDEHWSLEEELSGKQFPTQVGRALEELGIKLVVARSARAKGRIERTLVKR